MIFNPLICTIKLMNLYKSSLRVFSFDIVNAFNNAEVFPGSVFFHGKKAASIHVVGVDIDNKVLEVFQFCLTVIVIAQKLLYKLRLGFFKRDVIRVAAKNILELALQLVDIVVGLSSELEFHLFIPCLSSLIFLCPLVEIFAQVINDSVVVVAMLFPEMTELLLISLHNCKSSVSNLQTILQKSLDVGFVIVLLVDCEISLGFVKPDIGRMDVMVFQQSLLDISERHCLLLINRKTENHSEFFFNYTSRFS